MPDYCAVHGRGCKRLARRWPIQQNHSNPVARRNIIMKPFRIAFMAALCAGAAAPLFAEDGWVGKVVVVTRKDARFGFTDPNTKEQVVLGTLTQMDYVVRGEQANFVLVRQGDKEGWVAKSDVVLRENALNDFTSLIRSNARDDAAYAHRAGVYKRKGEVDAALKDLDQAIRLNPKVPVWWNNRANAWSDKKDYDKALKDFNEAIRLDPSYANAYNDRGNCWIAKKEYAMALVDYDAAIKLAPESVFPLNDKAWLLATCADAKFRDGKKAMALAKAACEMTGWHDTGYIDTLAAASAEAGQFDDAVKWQQKALDDTEYAKQFGDGAKKRLQLDQGTQPYREE